MRCGNLYFPEITVVAPRGKGCGGRGKNRRRETAGRVLGSDTGWDQGDGSKSERSKIPRDVFWKKNLQDLLVIVRQKERGGKEKN